MDLADSFQKIVTIANNAKSVAEGWNHLLTYLGSQVNASALLPLRDVALEENVTSLRQQLKQVLLSEPPIPQLKALYFGLFDALDEDENECLGFYVAGVVRFASSDLVPEARRFVGFDSGDVAGDPVPWLKRRCH